ncbi:hypothetical protein LTT66_12015 [Nocardia gipuzkoensis]|uniref:hypothetical protein n=1 Tax=Nocardia TaxID=1817 RepID=UPI001E44BC41|nr:MULTISPECIES: hypothetical protein [Nocardia]UGT70826.1 hypothetical protein LTT66_12015 [Nocardia gipuzkoensis]
MTVPESEFSPEQTVAQWQAQLLMRIRLLAAEHTRIADAGWEKFEALTSDGDQQAAWQAHLDGLEAQREQAEQTALTAGIEPAWIADARELGTASTRPRVEAGVRQNPMRDNAAQDFYIDMLSLDLWHLERMAALAAARADRISTGRWSFGTDPARAAQFSRNMQLYHQRVTALAHAAKFTATEADLFWGPAAEGARRTHAVHLETYDELDLVAQWNAYAAPSPDLAIPPYVPTDPDTGTPIAGAELTPPTPHQMIDTAAASLRAQFIDAALGDADTTNPDAAAITEAVDAALPAGTHVWDTEPDHTGPATEPGGTTDLGIAPY